MPTPPPGASDWVVKAVDGCRDIGAPPDVDTIYAVATIEPDCIGHTPMDSRVVVAGAKGGNIPTFGDPIDVPDLDARIHLVTPPEMSRGQTYLVEPTASSDVYLVGYNGGTGPAVEHLSRLFAPAR